MKQKTVRFRILHDPRDLHRPYHVQIWIASGYWWLALWGAGRWSRLYDADTLENAVQYIKDAAETPKQVGHFEYRDGRLVKGHYGEVSKVQDVPVSPDVQHMSAADVLRNPPVFPDLQ